MADPHDSAAVGAPGRAGAVVAVIVAVVVAGAIVVLALATPRSPPADAARPSFVPRPGQPDLAAGASVSAPRLQVAAAASLPPQQELASLLGQGADIAETGGHTDLLRQYFGAGLLVEAIIIVGCESGFDADAHNENVNGTADHGLFQINDVHRDSFEPVTGRSWDARYEPEPNVAFARWLYGHAGGWGPWRCNTSLLAGDGGPQPG